MDLRARRPGLGRHVHVARGGGRRNTYLFRDWRLTGYRAHAAQVGVAFAHDGKTYTLHFNRQGLAPGGQIKIEEGARTVLEHPFAQTVRDTYENWKGTEHFEKWMHEDRFKTYVTESDRRQFGAAR
jgi:hypothetical protein